MAEPSAGNPALLRLLRAEIESSGPITFARFMDLALHHPDHGYYATGAERLGRRGDFFTASDVGPAFGTCLARQLAEMDGVLGRPRAFRYVEFGAGRGLLASDVDDALAVLDADLSKRIEIELIDASAGMRAAAKPRLPRARVGAKVTRGGGEGSVVAVELFDALPVHRVRRRGNALVEVMIGLEGERLVEIEEPPEAAVRAWADRFGAAPDDGDEAEVGLAIGPTLAELAAAIDRGFLIIVDYGHEARRLFSSAHARGTLLAYHRHQVNEDYLVRVGEQDLTAHVNLTALRREAEALRLTVLGITTQDRFLIANGLLDGLDAEDDGPMAAAKRRREAKQLVHPHGMGTTFKIAVLSKGVEPAPSLRGLSDILGTWRTPSP